MNDHCVVILTFENEPDRPSEAYGVFENRVQATGWGASKLPKDGLKVTIIPLRDPTDPESN